MTFDPVSYEDVREACCILLGAGEGPSRPKVQDVLAERIGRKGSNSVVQGFINQFWAEAAERMNKPARQVADVPEVFVPIIDRALLEMVAVSRKMVEEEFAEREQKMTDQVVEWQSTVQQANDTAAVAEQLRLRAEGELNGLQSVVADLRGAVSSLEGKLAAEARQNDVHQQAIAEKDAELARQFVALDVAGQKLEQANETHHQEVKRLMKQVDDERQTAKRDAQALRQQIETARTEAEMVRRELSDQREENVRLKAEAVAKNATVASQATTIEGLKGKLEDAEKGVRMAQREVTVLQVKYETAEGLRKSAVEKCTSQAEELGELRQSVVALEIEHKRLIERSSQVEKSGL